MFFLFIKERVRWEVCGLGYGAIAQRWPPEKLLAKLSHSILALRNIDPKFITAKPLKRPIVSCCISKNHTCLFPSKSSLIGIRIGFPGRYLCISPKVPLMVILLILFLQLGLLR